jgi:hypothetical protein
VFSFLEGKRYEGYKKTGGVSGCIGGLLKSGQNDVVELVLSKLGAIHGLPNLKATQPNGQNRRKQAPQQTA